MNFNHEGWAHRCIKGYCIFSALAIILLILGFLISNGYLWSDKGSFRWLVIMLLIFTGLITIIQAVISKSNILGFMLSIAIPVGFWIRSYIEFQRPLAQAINLLAIGTTAGLIMGFTGHLIGSLIAEKRTPDNSPTKRGQILFGGAVILSAIVVVVI
jgi:hypothetical protein